MDESFSVCICVGSHELRRAMQWLELGGTALLHPLPCFRVVAKLQLPVRDGTGSHCAHRHGFRYQPCPCRCPCGNMGHIHQQGPWLYQERWPTHGPLWLPDRKPQLVSGGYTCHSHQHGSLRQQNLLTSQRHWAVYRLHVSIWISDFKVAWTTDNNTTSCGVLDHGGPLRESNPESEPFLISGLHLCPDPGPSLGWLGGRFQGLSLYIILLTPAGQWQHVDLSPLSHLSPPSCLPSVFLLCFGFSISGQGFLGTSDTFFKMSLWFIVWYYLKTFERRG